MIDGTSLRSVLFDLDGTLLDTAPDLAAALNHVLTRNHREALDFDTIRPWVSHGGIVLVKKGFGIETDHPEFDLYRQQLLDYYKGNIATHTQLFPGMADVLSQLEQNGTKWGVVTNKPAWLTEPLLEETGLASRCACIVSGDTLDERKPHPAPLQHACKLIGCTEKESLYIGDAERDIEAGRNAEMQTLVALFGYIGDEDNPSEWGANGMVSQPSEILTWITENTSAA